MTRKILIFAAVVALTCPTVLTGCKNNAEQERLQNELASAKAAAKTASDKAKKDRDEFTTIIKALTEERDALQKQLNDLQEQAASYKQLQEQVDKLTSERELLQKRLASDTGTVKTLQQKLTEATRSRDSLQQEVDALKTSEETAVGEAQKAEAKVEELTAKLKEETEKVGELQEQLQGVNVGEAAESLAIESPVIRSFTTTRPRISAGQKSTLSWWVTGADNVRIEPNIGAVGVLGSRTIAPTKTTTYTLIATNQDGESSVTRRIEVQ